MVTLPFHPLEVRATEHKVYRLFAIDLPARDIAAFTTPQPSNGGGAYPLRDALGVSYLDPQFVQVLKLADLGDMTLSAYMQEGLGIPANDLAEHAARLDALEGVLAVIHVSAFEAPAVLMPTPPVSLIGAFAEPEAMTGRVELSTTSVTKTGGPPHTPPAPERNGGAWHRLLWTCIGVGVAALAIYILFFAGGAS